ncbi:MAG: hypothetical protein NVS3B28_12840 [Candidatus Velthaea sp.]
MFGRRIFYVTRTADRAGVDGSDVDSARHAGKVPSSETEVVELAEAVGDTDTDACAEYVAR